MSLWAFATQEINPFASLPPKVSLSHGCRGRVLRALTVPPQTLVSYLLDTLTKCSPWWPAAPNIHPLSACPKKACSKGARLRTGQPLLRQSATTRKGPGKVHEQLGETHSSLIESQKHPAARRPRAREPGSRKGGYARTNLQGTESHGETKKISYTQSKVADGVWQKTKTSPMILSLNNVDTEFLDIGWTLLKTSTGGNFTWTTSSTSAGYESKLNFCINFF